MIANAHLRILPCLFSEYYFIRAGAGMQAICGCSFARFLNRSIESGISVLFLEDYRSSGRLPVSWLTFFFAPQSAIP